jgi:hypothetical protein
MFSLYANLHLFFSGSTKSLTRLINHVPHFYIQTVVCDFSRVWFSFLGPMVFLLPGTFKLFGFQIFWFWAYLKVIPVTRHVHQIWYLCFIITKQSKKLKSRYVPNMLSSCALTTKSSRFVSELILEELIMFQILILNLVQWLTMAKC